MIVRKISATEASRGFSDLLDSIEAGDTVVVTRGNRPIAEIRPVRRRTGRDLARALADTTPPDDSFTADISAAVDLLVADQTDPWADE